MAHRGRGPVRRPVHRCRVRIPAGTAGARRCQGTARQDQLTTARPFPGTVVAVDRRHEEQRVVLACAMNTSPELNRSQVRSTPAIASRGVTGGSGATLTEPQFCASATQVPIKSPAIQIGDSGGARERARIRVATALAGDFARKSGLAAGPGHATAMSSPPGPAARL